MSSRDQIDAMLGEHLSEPYCDESYPVEQRAAIQALFTMRREALLKVLLAWHRAALKQLRDAAEKRAQHAACHQCSAAVAIAVEETPIEEGEAM
jgi:hypothetical protein